MKTTLSAGLCSSLLIASVASFSATAGAAGITAVQGAVSNGSTITIVGTGFGAKPNGAKPLIYWDPGQTGSTNLDVLSRKTVWDNVPQYGSILSRTVAPGSTFSYEVIPSNALSPTGWRGIIPGILTGPTLKLYIFNKWRVNWSGTDAYNQRNDWNMKGWRWAAEPWNAQTIVEGFADNYADGTPRYYFENTAATGSRYAGSGLVKDSWRTAELQYLQGGLDEPNANLRVSANGKQEVDYTDYSRISGTYNKLYGIMYAHQFERISPLPDWRMWYDIVYLDDSWCRVVLTDQATWNASVNRGVEIQIPTAWSDTSVTVKVRQGAFSNFDGKYLYVIGADGQPVSATGYALCSNCVAPPSPPEGVRVQ